MEFAGAIGISFGAIDFNSTQSTKLIFVTLAPRHERERHVQLLSRLFALMRQKSITVLVDQRASPDTVYEHMCDLDRIRLN